MSRDYLRRTASLSLLLLATAAALPFARVRAAAVQESASKDTVSEPAPEPLKLADAATWLTTDPPDYGRGALLATAGLVGALVTMFFLVGGAVPGTAGQAKIDVDTKQLEMLSKRLSDLISTSQVDAAAVTAVEQAVNNFRDDLRAESWRQYVVAGTLYAILGSSIAALLARDLLQAVVIGAGWTGFIGSMGLKRDYAERKSIKDAALSDALSFATSARVEQRQRSPAAVSEGVDQLERNVRVAQAL